MTSRPRHRGFTVLEIVVSVFLLAVISASVFGIRKRQGEVDPEMKCEEEKWSRIAVVDELEWKLRRWEMLAGPCMKAGFLPVQSDPNGGEVTLWDVHSARSTMEAMTVPELLPIPKNHDFIIGETVLVCTEESFQQGVVVRFNNPSSKEPTMEVRFGDNPGQASNLFGAGSLVVQMRPYRYEMAPVPGTTGNVLFEQNPTNEKRAVASSIDLWMLIARLEPEDESLRVKIKLGRESCFYRREFSMSYRDSPSKQGMFVSGPAQLDFKPWADYGVE